MNVPGKYPVLDDYGPVHLFPEAAMQPDRTLRYRVIFDIAKSSKKPDEINPGLNHIARFLNIMGAGGIKPEDMDLAAVFHGHAVSGVLNNEVFRTRYNTDNPNSRLIKSLAKAGVKLYVCGQTLIEKEFMREWVHEGIALASAAMVVVSTCQLKGYAYQPFL